MSYSDDHVPSVRPPRRQRDQEIRGVNCNASSPPRPIHLAKLPVEECHKNVNKFVDRFVQQLKRMEVAPGLSDTGYVHVLELKCMVSDITPHSIATKLGKVMKKMVEKFVNTRDYGYYNSEEDWANNAKLVKEIMVEMLRNFKELLLCDFKESRNSKVQCHVLRKTIPEAGSKLVHHITRCCPPDVIVGITG